MRWRLLGLGYVLFRWRERSRQQGAAPRDFEPLRRRVQQTLQRGAALANCTRTANTCANLLKLGAALWTFSTNPTVPPTNNTAAQALRATVLKRKISGPTRKPPRHPVHRLGLQWRQGRLHRMPAVAQALRKTSGSTAR